MAINKKQPLHRLLLQLQAAGFRFTPADRLRIQQLMAAHIQELTTLEGQRDFKYQLAPLIAKTAHEQKLFYQVYDTYLEEIQQPLETVPPPPLPPPVEEEPAQNWKWLWALLVLLLLGAIVVGRWWTVTVDLEKSYAFQERNNRTRFAAIDSIFLDNKTEPRYQEDVRFQWELVDGQGRQAGQFEGTDWALKAPQLPRTTTYQAIMAVRDLQGDTLDVDSLALTVQCFQAPLVNSIRPEPLTGDTLIAGIDIAFSADVNTFDRPVAYRWDFGDNNTDTLPNPVHRYTANQTYTISLEIYDRNDRACSNRATYTLDLEDKIPPLPVPNFVRDEAAEKSYGWLPYLLILLLAGLTAWLWRRYFRQRKREAENRKLAVMQMGKQFNAPDKPPYQPPFRSRDDMVRREARQFAIANIFRQREKGNRRFLDVPQTIRKTAEGGGFPGFSYRYRTRPADYLFLIDEHRPKGHQVQLFRHLVEMLRQQDVYIDVFYYQDVPRYVWNDDFEDGLSLDQLSRLFAERRLVVFGDGREWGDEMETGSLAPDWQVALRGWKSRLMVTPVPMNSWTFRETALYQLMALFPADLAHLMLAAEYIEGGMDEAALPTTLRQWESQLQRNRYDVDINRKWRKYSDYEDYLRNHPEVFRWLQALIVHPEPNWNITIAIGKALGIPVSYDNLLLLARIPWLNDRPLKVKLWRAFWAHLSPEDERKARAAVLEELEAIADDHPDSFANQQLQMELAIQRFALDPTNPEHQRNIQYLEGDGFLDDQRLEELDLILKRQIDDLRDTGLKPGDVLRLFLAENEAKPAWFTAGLAWAALATMLTLWLAGCLAGWFLMPDALPTIEGLVAEQPSELAQLNNAAVDSFAVSGQLPAGYSAPRFAAADSLLDRALAIDSSYVPARLNKGYIRYAHALTGYYDYSDNRQDTVLGSNTREDFRIATRFDSVYTDALHGLGLMHHYLGRQDSACIILRQWQSQQILESERIYPNLSTLVTYCGELKTQTVYVYYQNEWERPVANAIVEDLQSLPGVVAVQEATKFVNATEVVYFNSEDEALYNTVLQVVEKALIAANFDPTNITTRQRVPPLVPSTGSVQRAAEVQVFLNLPEPVNTLTIAGRVTTGGANRNNQAAQSDAVPLADVRVEMTINNRELDQETNANGQFNLELSSNDLGQTLRLQINQDAYEPFAQEYVIAEGLNLEIDLTPFTPKPLPPVVEYESFPSLPEGPYACRRIQSVDNAIAFRREALTQASLNEINAGRDSALNAQTLIQRIPAGTEVELIDSATVNYRIRYQGQIGFMARRYRNASTLEACAPAPPPPTIAVPEMVAVAGGSFTMGCTEEQGDDCYDSEKPPHEVTVSDFSIGKYEVTKEQYVAFLNTIVKELEVDGNSFSYQQQPIFRYGGTYDEENVSFENGQFVIEAGYENHPIVSVSWYGAVAYCQWLSQQTGRNYRLPTEAEWEFAARGGNQGKPTKYAGSDDLDAVGWYVSNSSSRTHPVGQKAANELGLYDMSGNVYEWCSDWYGSEYYQELSNQGTVSNPKGQESGTDRVLRGGSWDDGARGCRSSSRNGFDPDFRFNNIGFRLVLVP